MPVVSSWLGSAENMMYRTDEPKTEAEVRDYLHWAITSADAKTCKDYEYAVVLKSENKLIGAATLINVPINPEIGWIVHRDYWRQGFGSEIGRALLALCFDTLKLRRVIAACNDRNIGSYRVMERIGMRKEGQLVAAQPGNSALNYEWCDTLLYAMLQDEWHAYLQRGGN